ncbi:MAG: cyclic nucleotide-binding domain-containing protein [Bdellovibrionales bacterium]|nr:cyclic nucleotide-binding domain-containing protein [Bdellovibrionales bacterium]
MIAMWDNLFRNKDAAAEVREILKGTYIFQDLNQKELKLLEGMVHVRIYKVGEPIFRQGEIGVGVYVLKAGGVEISIENPEPNANSEEPQITVVTQLRAGDFFGELSLVEDNSRRGASAIATEESVLIGFFKPDLFEIIERNPSMGSKVLLRLSEALGRRLRVTTGKVRELNKEIKNLKVTDGQ